MTPEQIIARRTRVVVMDVVDNCGDVSRIGHRGKIVGVDVAHLGRPNDPYWTLEFADRGRDCFWSEEIALVPEDVEANHKVNLNKRT